MVIIPSCSYIILPPCCHVRLFEEPLTPSPQPNSLVLVCLQTSHENFAWHGVFVIVGIGYDEFGFLSWRSCISLVVYHAKTSV